MSLHHWKWLPAVQLPANNCNGQLVSYGSVREHLQLAAHDKKKVKLLQTGVKSGQPELWFDNAMGIIIIYGAKDGVGNQLKASQINPSLVFLHTRN